MTTEHVNVLPENEYLVDRFIRELYGSPDSWGGGEGLIVKGYPGLKIESRKEFMKENYKTRIIIREVDGRIKEKLIYFATTKNLPLSEGLFNIEKIARELKKDFLFKIDRGIA